MKTNKYIGKHAICLFEGDGFFGRTGTIVDYNEDYPKYPFIFEPHGENEKWFLNRKDFHCSEIDGMNPVAMNPKYIKN